MLDLKRGTVLIPLLLLTGCDTLPYYQQAALGQWEILRKRQPIEALLANHGTDATLKKKLTLIQEARQFAERELLLTPGNNYTAYTALDRPYAVWNVFAAQEFSIAPQTWCFPIAGCISYRGYFNEADANQYAQRLNALGFETYVGGVEAYSTLGWFDDPIMSTFVMRNDASLAGLIFHELAHRTLYVTDDSTFNESFATAVEQEGVRRWMIHTGQDAQWQKYLQHETYHDEFTALVMKHREQLKALYSSTVDDAEKRRKKLQLKEKFLSQYKQLRDEKWQGFSGYDKWMSGPLNNAQLSTISTYHAYVPAFKTLLKYCKHDMACFHQQARTLAAMEANERKAAISSQRFYLSYTVKHHTDGQDASSPWSKKPRS